ncbi:hypothetical protein DSO57_1000428 [Entomophthora muscae]|uniref:Uncharacterized protein n=1 Tax=Entomophthora muscae TaxID=34485 RepID=A0ACC2UJ24_9FUNG|nr:hypothetical protein DSO57_1000428 [Entomophthora muscae]
MRFFSLVFVCIWGLVSDITGRRAVFSLGFFAIGISFFLYTLPTTALPDLLLVRLFFAIGASACTSMLTAGLADIVGEKNGMTSGIVGMFSGIGAVFAIFLLVPLPTVLDKLTGVPEDSLKYTLYIAGALSLIWSGVTMLSYQKKPPGIELQSRLPLSQKVQGAIKDFPRAFGLMTSDIKIAMGYISGFVVQINFGSLLTSRREAIRLYLPCSLRLGRLSTSLKTDSATMMGNWGSG